MVSKYKKTEVYQECTSVFFDFVHDVLRLLIVYSIIILRHRKPFSFHTNNIDTYLKNHYIFSNKSSINNGKKTSKRWVCNLQVVS